MFSFYNKKNSKVIILKLGKIQQSEISPCFINLEFGDFFVFFQKTRFVDNTILVYYLLFKTVSKIPSCLESVRFPLNFP